jgi:arsenate reductase
LAANDVVFEERDIKENNPTIEELKDWQKKSGLPLKKFFNTSGLIYRELKLKDKLPTMSEDDQYSLLASDGMLVKRPILIGDGFVLVGFKETDWKAALDI